jgi:hypothetical protein
MVNIDFTFAATNTTPIYVPPGTNEYAYVNNDGVPTANITVAVPKIKITK